MNLLFIIIIAPQGYKSALHNYYKEQKEDFTFMDTELSAFYQSLKKREAKEKEDGERRVKVGKDAMPFEIFCMLAEQYAKEGNYFAWAYLILSWNLVCRTKNTEMIKFAHIGWSADSMIIWFARMTNDQGVIFFFIFIVTILSYSFFYCYYCCFARL